MLVNLSLKHSLITNWVSELRDVNVQNDRMRFRRNLERIGEVMAYEISKELEWNKVETQTPLGIHNSKKLAAQPVLATILRAGLPLHNGMMNYFDKADHAFISAYRKHHADGTFEISLEYMSCPSLENRTVIISDPMLATGGSLVATVDMLKRNGCKEIIAIVMVAAPEGVKLMNEKHPDVQIVAASLDSHLNEQGYIIPGLGDAGDKIFGTIHK